jgi:hypothetical protein
MPKRWAIQVVLKNGDVCYLRHGNRIGMGAIATFGTRKLAGINCDFIQQGLDAGSVASVVAWQKQPSRQKEPTT